MDAARVAVEEEDEARVRVHGLDVARAVPLLVVPRLLVPADHAGLVVRGLDAGDDPGEGPIAGRDLVDVEPGRGVLDHQPVSEEVRKTRCGERVDLVVVGREVGEVRIRADHREERERVLFEDGAGLGGRHDVVRDRRDRLGVGRGGPDAGERMEYHHDSGYTTA